MLTTKQIIEIFGKAGDDRNLVTVQMPYPRKIAWDLKVITNRMQCHKLVAPIFQSIHESILKEYGLKNIQELEIDIFGGCYNFRKMRGGNDWSRHSWGVAEDLNPIKNDLRMNSSKAQFAKKEYKAMMQIYYKHGFVNQGIEKGTDFMHFQFQEFIK
jgi:hypothetical protein